jgi:cysteine desulfurase / selenocysteine lyase
VFDKSEALFPVRRDHIDLATCSIGPMYGPSAQAAQDFITAQSERGMLLKEHFGDALDGFRAKVSELLEVTPADIAYVSNTAEGIGLIANGYPFEPGDQVVTYEHEFPSNHFPWVLQRHRGVEVIEVPDDGVERGRPYRWTLEKLDDVVTGRTRVVALSHVQFASGFAAELSDLGSYCEDRGIDLVIDAAQSLGALPIHPEEHGISAIVSAGWKWMLASRGAGLLYAHADFREKVQITMVGDATMTHRLDYLNRTWEPDPGARRFEYSTLPWEHLVAIETVVREVFLRYGMSAIRDELFRLQDLLISQLTNPRIRPVVFERQNRSGILACETERSSSDLVEELRTAGIVATSQAGYLRIAPHFFVTDDDICRVADQLNRLC